jgi:hypothetical protein
MSYTTRRPSPEFAGRAGAVPVGAPAVVDAPDRVLLAGVFDRGSAGEPVLGDADEPVLGDADEPVLGDADEPVLGDADEPVLGDADEPAPDVGTVLRVAVEPVDVDTLDDCAAAACRGADAAPGPNPREPASAITVTAAAPPAASTR